MRAYAHLSSGTEWGVMGGERLVTAASGVVAVVHPCSLDMRRGTSPCLTFQEREDARIFHYLDSQRPSTTPHDVPVTTSPPAEPPRPSGGHDHRGHSCRRISSTDP